MRVLIAEDDPIIVEGLKIALSQEGYEVVAFENMNSAIAEVKEEVHFDVCLLDITLPDGDGYQICRAIREKSDVPIIFLTACMNLTGLCSHWMKMTILPRLRRQSMTATTASAMPLSSCVTMPAHMISPRKTSMPLRNVFS